MSASSNDRPKTRSRGLLAVRVRSGTGSATGALRDRWRLWLGGLVGAAALIGLGVWAHGGVESRLNAMLADDLEAILAADVTALRMWLGGEEALVETGADHEVLRGHVEALLAQGESASADALLAAPAQVGLRAALNPLVRRENKRGFGIVSLSGRFLAASEVEAGVVGLRASAGASAMLAKVFAGDVTVNPPYAAGALAEGFESPTDDAVMSVAAPLHDADGRVVAALIVRLDAQAEFSRILRVARMGRSGETYAVNEKGVMISASLFEEQLTRLRLIPDGEDAESVFGVQVRDPGGDLTQGHETEVPLAQRPLTRAAASAVTGVSGSDVRGYRDYRGVPVVGAWKWLPEYRFGVITEKDLAEAHAPLRHLQRVMWTLLGVIALALAAMVVAARRVQRLERTVARGQQLGQYTLEQKIGEGGMGVVYRARHALMRRPTAVKLLKPEISSPEAIARFEREVQLSSRLGHPNTIEIYDYGRTDEGTFYYAMELLSGMTLRELVRRDGPLGPARAISILRQVCGSLGEAHQQRLVHRDVKPQNIALCQRGGLCDVVKVLDFGLVKDTGSTDVQLTGTHQITGTPQYMAPEQLRDATAIGPAVDIYALGAVAHFLLTGRPVFDATSLVEMCGQILNDEPQPVGELAPGPIPAELEQLILACLAKDPAERPPSAEALAERLVGIAGVERWTQRDARAWWAAETEAAGTLADGDEEAFNAVTGSGDGVAT